MVKMTVMVQSHFGSYNVTIAMTMAAMVTVTMTVGGEWEK